MTIAEEAADTDAAKQVKKPGARAKLVAAIWLVLSLLALVAAAAVLVFAIYHASSFVFGQVAIQQAVDSVRQVPVKSMDSAPQSVQRRFFVLLNVLFFCLGAPVLLAALIGAGRQWRQRLALVVCDRKPAKITLALLFFAMPAYLIVASAMIKYFYPGFTTWFFVPEDPATMALSFLAVVIMAPLAEELLFRGWIFGGLCKAFPPASAVFVTTLLFALAHGDGGMLYPLAVFVPGLVLTLVRYWSGTVWAGFAAHATYNAWAWFLVFALGKDFV